MITSALPFRKLLLVFYSAFCIGGSAFSQSCPGQSFFDYTGGNISYASSDSMGKCYHNLVAGQTYCFSFMQPDSGIIEADINLSGCTTCPTSMYGNVGASSAISILNGGGSANTNGRCVTVNGNAACSFSTYGPACNLINTGARIGGCNGFVTGQVYTICFTVPASCGGMSICPLYRCLNCAICTPPVVDISHSATIGCDSNTIYLGYGPQSVTLTAHTSSNISTYQWFRNGIAITGDSANTLSVNSSGTYNVIATDIGGCKSDSTGNATTINVVDIRCGHNSNKVTLCHVPDCRYDRAVTLCIPATAVAAHLSNHSCDYLGKCRLPHPHPHLARMAEITGYPLSLSCIPILRQASLLFM